MPACWPSTPIARCATFASPKKGAISAGVPPVLATEQLHHAAFFHCNARPPRVSALLSGVVRWRHSLHGHPYAPVWRVRRALRRDTFPDVLAVDAQAG